MTATDRRALVQACGAIRVRIPFRRPFTTSAGTWHEREAWIVRLRDEAGRDGFGEAVLDPAAGPRARDQLAEALRAGLDRVAADHELGDWLEAPSDHGTVEPMDLAVRAAIAGAALDLGLVDLGPEPAVTIAVNATIATEDPAASVAAARAAADRGFRCLKLKVGSEGTTAQLVDRIGAVRVAVGPDVSIRLDANGAWDAATALQRAAGVVALDIAYLEQPILAGAPADLAELRRASPVAIAADESVASITAALALLATDAADVLVVKPARVGGPASAMAIARGAIAAGVGVTVSTLLETGVGLAAAARVAAALPDHDHAHGLATADVLVDNLLAAPMRSAGGRLTVPPPGLRLDEAALARWTIGRIGPTW